MIVSIDSETARHLRSLVGMRLVRMIGHRYPNPALYDHVQLVTDNGVITGVSLRSHVVSEKLEVFCFVARRADELSDSDPHDELQLDDFRIDQVLVCRRAEWLDSPEMPMGSVGSNAEEQRFGAADEAPPWTAHALVDAGLVLVDGRGATLFLQADAFPLLIQCHYSLSSGHLPRGEVRDVSERDVIER